MKKTLVTLLAIVPCLAFAQVKPSISKAEKALREGKLDEAKSIIDATVGSQEFMVDKKGQPTKNAAKAWYLKGLVYFSIDTTKLTQWKSLSADPFSEGKDAFEKAYAIDSKSPNFFNDNTGLPLLNVNVNNILGYNYYNKAIVNYNDKGDAKATFAYAEKTLYFIPKDTSILLYAGGVFAPSAGETDKGLDMLRRYLEAGGNLPEVYTMMANIQHEQKKDNAAALKILAEGKAKFPNYRDIRLIELNIYLADKKYDVAKTMVEKELQENPTSADNYFLYGQLNRELGDMEKAKAAFKKVVELDPKHFDASAELANLYWADAKKFKDEMGKLGNTKADLEKAKAIDVKYVEALKTYIPYIEACEKLSPDDVTVLYSLLNVYGDLDDQPKIAKVKKKLKALGEDVN
ncbi:MAG: tetratricopeptide repeat protein [Cyclobacteriaceae bacterium]|nr:tetratricopeptide repeat protein [Cyclobacteriaceae bacterium]